MLSDSSESSNVDNVLIDNQLSQQNKNPIDKKPIANVEESLISNSHDLVDERERKLVELTNSIELKSSQLAELVERYSADLTDQESRDILSSALKNDRVYKEEILEKFKLDQDKLEAQ